MGILRSFRPEIHCEAFERSTDYRRKYLAKHRGMCGVYSCSYCGALVPKHLMEVDHIFPVHKAKETLSGKAFVLMSASLQNPLHAKEGVNGTWNTCCSCHKCNHTKSAKGGIWVIRGYVGRIIFPIANILLAGYIFLGAICAIVAANTMLYTALGIFIAYRFLCNVLFRRSAR